MDILRKTKNHPENGVVAIRKHRIYAISTFLR